MGLPCEDGALDPPPPGNSTFSCDRGHHHGWQYGAKGSKPMAFTRALPTSESLAASARRTALQIRLGTRFRNAKRLGVAHVGAKHYTEAMMRESARIDRPMD